MNKKNRNHRKNLDSLLFLCFFEWALHDIDRWVGTGAKIRVKTKQYESHRHSNIHFVILLLSCFCLEITKSLFRKLLNPFVD